MKAIECEAITSKPIAEKFDRLKLALIDASQLC
jgi:hypothetical protein